MFIFTVRMCILLFRLVLDKVHLNRAANRHHGYTYEGPMQQHSALSHHVKHQQLRSTQLRSEAMHAGFSLYVASSLAAQCVCVRLLLSFSLSVSLTFKINQSCFE